MTSLVNLAYTYGEAGDHQNECVSFEKVYALRCKILGEEHPDTLKALNNLAVAYGKLGNHQKEQELFIKLYTLYCAVFSNLAHTCSQLGDYNTALELYEKLYALRCKVLGKDHEDTLKTAARIQEIKSKLSASNN